jgi:tetratricopeptide (TPR) repeat protein
MFLWLIRYEEAEDLLLNALYLEDRQLSLKSGGNNNNNIVSISKAATLQQLGRVSIRRGQLEKAENYLNQAFMVYKTFYGEKRASEHINVASVHFQLGMSYLYVVLNIIFSLEIIFLLHILIIYVEYYYI